MKPVVFALPGNDELAKKVADAIPSEYGEMILRHFPDSEVYVRVKTEVKNRRIILVCSLEYPDSKILPLYMLSRTLKELNAGSICLVTPYLPYMRQDKAFNEGEGITSNYFAALISGFIDSMLTIDPHLHRRRSLSEIYTIQCTTLHASVLISRYIKEQISNPVLIGPDAESEQWVSEVAKNSDSPYLVLEKTRLEDKIVKITVPFLENFRNHTPVLVDDIISTAGTMIETISHLSENDMKPAICIGIHGVFAEKAYHNLISSRVEKVITCNTILHESNGIDISPLIINEIKRLF